MVSQLLSLSVTMLVAALAPLWQALSPAGASQRSSSLSLPVLAFSAPMGRRHKDKWRRPLLF